MTVSCQISKRLMLSLLLPACSYAISAAGPLYVSAVDNDDVYSVDRQTGVKSIIATFPAGSQVVDISLLNSNLAYVLANGASKYVYSLDLNTGSSQLITPTPIGSNANVSAIVIANSNTAYVTAYDQYIYTVNLNSGTSASVAFLPSAANGIALANETLGYVSCLDNNIYAVDLATGNSRLITQTPVGGGGAAINAIALASDAVGYVDEQNFNFVYSVDLVNGTWAQITPSAVTADGGFPTGMALDNTTGYVATYSDNTVVTVNLLTGSFAILTTDIPNAWAVGLLSQISTQGLSGNNLHLANYLNTNAPSYLVRTIGLQTTQLNQALESVAPTRNGFVTYASQNGYLAASQALSDHGRPNRFQKQLGKQSHNQQANAVGDIPASRYLVEQSDGLSPTLFAEASEATNPKHSKYCAWASPFGEYAKEKAQNQTPSFEMGVGGVVVGLDYLGRNQNIVGFGGAYVYTHVHEGNGAGYANLNQGYLTLYGTLHYSDWYFDLGLWGGYYSANNHRHIRFPGVDETAKATIQGWQLAPHFEVGYDRWWPQDSDAMWFGIEPFLMADWVANIEQGFNEHGAGSYNMGQKSRFASFFRGESGLRFHETATFSWGHLIFCEKGSYTYQKAFHTGAITAFLVGSPGTFTVNTLTGAQNLGVIELSMLYISSSGKAPYIDIRYQGEFGAHYQSHQGILEIGKNF